MPGPPRVTPSWERAAARAVFAVALIVAAAFRLTDLERRPMHGDEANQGVKAGALLERGEYRYDPKEHHGPTLYYAALPIAWARGQHSLAELDEVSLRLVPALFGIATVALIWTLRGAIGELAAAMAALLTALSPAFVYYNRYFIQESLLVFFMVAALSAGLRYATRPGYAPALAFGVALGLAHATKETAALVIMCGVVAGGIVWFLGRGGSRGRLPHITTPRNHALAAVLAAACCSMLLYSSFFTNPRGIIDSVATYANYFQRADGAGLHDKPWYYYLSLLAYVHRSPGPWWSEGLVLVLAAVGGVVAWWNGVKQARFIAVSAA
ncbi:MAG: flippase activity-associated protein Agl23, partial [Candidatus Hydrogenedentota bacterium]